MIIVFMKNRTMRKIERIIDNCNDCRYSRAYSWAGSNCDWVLICFHTDTNTGGLDAHPIVLATNSGSNFTITVEIPKNCPLTTYNV
jgi:hypothetical protein